MGDTAILMGTEGLAGAEGAFALPGRRGEGSGPDGPQTPSFGERLVSAIEGFGASLHPLDGRALDAVRAADRKGLLRLLEERHETVPVALAVAIRTQEPEALAFRLAGDPRLLRATLLLALRGTGAGRPLPN